MEVGCVTEGKITGIAKFGAFVALPDGTSGLVHISEISTGYVTDINEHLKVGDTVKVKVVGVDEKGRTNLSIRQALAPEHRPRTAQPHREEHSQRNTDAPKAPPSFEDMLLKFKQDSDSKLSDLKAKEDGGRRKRSRK